MSKLKGVHLKERLVVGEGYVLDKSDTCAVVEKDGSYHLKFPDKKRLRRIKSVNEWTGKEGATITFVVPGKGTKRGRIIPSPVKNEEV